MLRRSPVLLVCLLCTARAQAAPVASKGGMVASANEEASRAGVEMLKKGGNAFDAAVATAFVLGVAQPYMSGIGGGGFLVGYDQAAKRPFAVDFREVAPAKAARDMYLGPDGKPDPARSTDGALSIGVPGAARGYVEIQKRFGKLPLAAVLGPAISLAEKGFVVTPQYRRVATERQACLARFPSTAEILLAKNKDGSFGVPELGARIVEKDLAKTLREMAKKGAAAFYEGRVAKGIVDAVAKEGGVLTAEDLAKYKVRDREPLRGSYRGFPIATMPPPSAGGIAVLQVLNVLERVDVAKLGFHDPAVVHLYAEAVKQSYADRAAMIGDPDFAKFPADRLISKDYAGQLFAEVNGKPARPAAKVAPFHEGEHTTHLSVVDAEGNAAAITTTQNYYFGSCLIAKGTGVLLNDQMDDFAAKPGSPNTYGLVTGEANAVAPGKVPLSSMAPTIVFQPGGDKVLLVIGSPGGPTIPTTVVQAVVNVLDYKMPLDRALATPRIHHQYLPDVLRLEPNALETATVDALTKMGHTVEVKPYWGDAHAVFVDPESGVRFGASDQRGEGRPVGE